MCDTRAAHQTRLLASFQRICAASRAAAKSKHTELLPSAQTTARAGRQTLDLLKHIEDCRLCHSRLRDGVHAAVNLSPPAVAAPPLADHHRRIRFGGRRSSSRHADLIAAFHDDRTPCGEVLAVEEAGRLAAGGGCLRGGGLHPVGWAAADADCAERRVRWRGASLDPEGERNMHLAREIVNLAPRRDRMTALIKRERPSICWPSRKGKSAHPSARI